jgi:hypothetical protein
MALDGNTPSRRHHRSVHAASTEGPDSPAHSHQEVQYVNGWCLMVWILHHPTAHAPPLTPDSNRMQLAGAGPIHGPSQPQAERVVNEVRLANEILAQCAPDVRVAFRVCDIVVLDTSQITIEIGGAARPLSDRFDASGRLTIGAGEQSFAGVVERILNNGPQAVVNLLNKRSMHVFFVHDVRDADPSPEEGLGSVVDAGRVRPHQTLVHEILHATGQEEHSTEDDNIHQEEIDEDDVKVTAAQSRRMLTFLVEHVDPACP